MPRSEANVRTPHAQHHLARLCEHFATTIAVKSIPGDALIDFTFGSCRLAATDDQLLIQVDGLDEICRARIEYLIGEHLERIGDRECLTVDWQPVTDSASA